MSRGNIDASTLAMDFGRLEAGDTSFSLLQIHNPNPVPILVTDLVALHEGLEFAFLTQVQVANEGVMGGSSGSSSGEEKNTEGIEGIEGIEGDLRAGVSGRGIVVAHQKVIANIEAKRHRTKKGKGKSGKYGKHHKYKQHKHKQNMAEQHFLKPYKTTRSMAHAAVALSAVAYQASSEEVTTMETMLHKQHPEEWWQAVDGMTLERCRRARKDWSWTCDMHASGADKTKNINNETSVTGAWGGSDDDIHEEMLLERALETAGLVGFCASDAGCHNQRSRGHPNNPNNLNNHNNHVSLRRLEWLSTARSASKSWKKRAVNAKSVVYLVVRYRTTSILPPMLLLPDKIRLTTGVMQQVSVALRFDKKNMVKRKKIKHNHSVSYSIGAPSVSSAPVASSSSPASLSQGYGFVAEHTKGTYQLKLYDHRVDVVLPIYMTRIGLAEGNEETEKSLTNVPSITSLLPVGTTSDRTRRIEVVMTPKHTFETEVDSGVYYVGYVIVRPAHGCVFGNDRTVLWSEDIPRAVRREEERLPPRSRVDHGCGLYGGKERCKRDARFNARGMKSNPLCRFLLRLGDPIQTSWNSYRKEHIVGIVEVMTQYFHRSAWVGARINDHNNHHQQQQQQQQQNDHSATNNSTGESMGDVLHMNTSVRFHGGGHRTHPMHHLRMQVQVSPPQLLGENSRDEWNALSNTGMVQFGLVDVKSTSTQHVYIQNPTNAPIAYKLAAQGFKGKTCWAMFCCCCCCGGGVAAMLL